MADQPPKILCVLERVFHDADSSARNRLRARCVRVWQRETWVCPHEYRWGERNGILRMIDRHDYSRRGHLADFDEGRAVGAAFDGKW